MATITVGVNSYADVAFADAYFSDRYGFEKWASEVNKEQALISATQILDSLCVWESVKVDPDQKLEFPRVGADPTPEAIKQAQCEIAYAIIDSGSTSTEGERLLKSLEAKGNLEWFGEKNYENPLVNDLVKSLLSTYGLCSVGSITFPSIGRS